MPNQYLADELLIEAVRAVGTLARSDEESTTSRIRGFINREQRLYLAKLLLSAREEYQTDTALVTLVSGTTRYRIPSRAMGAGLKLVQLVGASGDVALYPLPKERAAVFGGDGYGTGDFYLEGNYIVFLREPSGTSIRFTYFRRLNKVVAAEEAGEITAINTVTKVVTIAAAVTDFGASGSFDFIRGTPHFDILGKDEAATVSSTTLTFAETLPTELAVGDFVALAGETPICNVALELQDVLVQRACFKYLEAEGDPKAGTAKASLDEMEGFALSIISPRVQASPQLLINMNAPGWNRSRRRGG